jgi:hypothetical protein
MSDEYRPDVMLGLAQQIGEVIDASQADTAEVLETLRSLTTCLMASLCPDCRKSYAKYLTKTIPHMLTASNKMAAMDTESVPQGRHLH